MRSFRLEEIDAATLDGFNATHPQGNFQQISQMAEVRRANGVDVHLLGVFEDGKLVAATVLEVHRSRFSTFAQIHDGPLCDFHDAELTAFFFSELKRLVRKVGAAQLELTPEASYEIHDSHGLSLPARDSGEPWPQGVPKDAPVGPDVEAFANLIASGLVHSGFDHTYNAVPRWRFVKDLSGIPDERALLLSYAKNTRRNVSIARESSVFVERVTRDRLCDFHTLCEMSCEKNGFDNRSLDYFLSLYDHLGDIAEFYIASIDARSYLASWEDKRDSFASDIDRLERLRETSSAPEKVEGKLRDATSKLEAAKRRVEGARRYLKEDGETICAAAAMFVWQSNECTYLYSGSNPKFAKFYATTAIQHHVMCECLERGVSRYNFYGIDGIFDDPLDPGRGLLEFKQGFGGYVQEMMGEFTLVVRPWAYTAKRLAHKVLGR